ncbi:MAG: HTTM domain-containing protein [Nannocystaceae bacterium]
MSLDLLERLAATTPTNEVRLFAAYYCLAFALQLALGMRRHSRYLRVQPSPAGPPRPRLLGLLALPTLAPRTTDALGVGLLLALLLAALGPAPRLATLIALGLYFAYFSQLLNLGSVIRKTNTAPQVLLVLAAAPGLDAPLCSANASWPLDLIRALVALVYFASGVAKLRAAGLGWVNHGRTLQAYLLEHWLLLDTQAGRRLAGRRRVCAALSAATLAWELSAPLLLLAPSIAPAWVACALLFHAGTLVTMRINYLKYTGIVLPVFLTASLSEHLPRLAARLAELLSLLQ